MVFSDVRNYIYVSRPGSAMSSFFDFRIEYTGFIRFIDASPYMAFVTGHSGTEDVWKEYMGFVSGLLYRAIVEIRVRSELECVTDRDMEFFRRYFIPSSSRQALDRQMISRFHKMPILLIPYLSAGRMLRSLRILLKSSMVSK